jgi:signal transduction histidine kinase
MVVEVLIYVPSIANFKRGFLEQKLMAAQVAALSLEEIPNQEVSGRLEEEILDSADILAVIVLRGDSRQLMLRRPFPYPLVDRFGLDEVGYFDLLKGAAMTLSRRGKGVIQISGPTISERHDRVEVVLAETTLYAEMMEFTWNVLGVSILISVFTAGLVYLSLALLVTRPIGRITRGVNRFRENPESAPEVETTTTRSDEIGTVERELARMQDEIRKALKQSANLAALGAAVSKVNHDLRNILATAQLSLDRLQAVDNPVVKTALPRLIGSVDRAIRFCERTLKYGRADEPPPERTRVSLHDLVEEVKLSLGAEEMEELSWQNEVPEDLVTYLDPEQIFRVLLNLGRNSVLAMRRSGEIRFATEVDKAGEIMLMVSDSGPGIPGPVREHLFVPFKGGSKGSTGLGLVIARELLQAHGGDIRLQKNDGEGTAFELRLGPLSSGPEPRT